MDGAQMVPSGGHHRVSFALMPPLAQPVQKPVECFVPCPHSKLWADSSHAECLVAMDALVSYTDTGGINFLTVMMAHQVPCQLKLQCQWMFDPCYMLEPPPGVSIPQEITDTLADACDHLAQLQTAPAMCPSPGMMIQCMQPLQPPQPLG